MVRPYWFNLLLAWKISLKRSYIAWPIVSINIPQIMPDQINLLLLGLVSPVLFFLPYLKVQRFISLCEHSMTYIHCDVQSHIFFFLMLISRKRSNSSSPLPQCYRTSAGHKRQIFRGNNYQHSGSPGNPHIRPICKKAKILMYRNFYEHSSSDTLLKLYQASLGIATHLL